MHISKDKIDQIFSEKLEGHTIKPRALAWEKLERKLEQNQKKVIPFWRRYSIAASVAALLLMGFIFYFNLPKTNELPVASTVSTKENMGHLANKPLENLKKENLTNSQDSPTFLVKNETKIPNIRRNLNPIFENTETKMEEIPEEFATTEIIKTEEKAIAVIEKPQNHTSEINTVAMDNKSISTKAFNADEDLTIVFTVANFENNPEVIQDSPENEKKPKYISRFFKQLINAKNGDKVNWNEVGFKPAKILARAENKLKNTKDDVNDTYQTVKNKTVF